MSVICLNCSGSVSTRNTCITEQNIIKWVCGEFNVIIVAIVRMVSGVKCALRIGIISVICTVSVRSVVIIKCKEDVSWADVEMHQT